MTRAMMMLGSGDGGDGGGRTMVMMKSRMILMLQSKYTNALHQTRFEGFSKFMFLLLLFHCFRQYLFVVCVNHYNMRFNANKTSVLVHTRLNGA